MLEITQMCESHTECVRAGSSENIKINMLQSIKERVNVFICDPKKSKIKCVTSDESTIARTCRNGD